MTIFSRPVDLILHIDIKNNKVWIQHNRTERRIAQELIEVGLSNEDIVWHSMCLTEGNLQGIQRIKRRKGVFEKSNIIFIIPNCYVIINRRGRSRASQ